MNKINQDSGQNKREFRFYTAIAGLFIATLLISNTTAQKIFQIGPFFFPGGIIIFPVSYIFGDILTEVYGYARARRIIWTGFIAIIMMAVIYMAVIALPPAPYWPHQEALEIILSQVPRIVIATILGYIVGEFANSFVLAKMKVWTKGRYLWTRTIGSTIIGQGVDTFIFIIIAFAGLYDTSNLLWMGIFVYIFKVSYEAVITPITYLIVRMLKTAEKIDYYDIGTKFTPFKWKE